MGRSQVLIAIVKYWEIIFEEFQPMWSQSTNVTDGQTDDMRSQYRALHYSASHGKNNIHNFSSNNYTVVWPVSKALQSRNATSPTTLHQAQLSHDIEHCIIKTTMNI